MEFNAGASTSHAGRRATQYGATAGGARAQPKNKAVAAVLGGDLFLRTRREGVQQKSGGGGGGEIDVELLLHGAEKLAGV